MYLTREEEKVLDGEYGEGQRLAMKILCALGDFFEAERLISVQSAHVSGVSYKTGGDALISTLEKFAGSGAKTSILTTLNPGGVDLERWRDLRVDENFLEKQKKIISLYAEMGVLPTCSCTPYEVGNIPAEGVHVAFAESSAVTLVNSYFKAKTNRESGISALASAVTGKTPLYGLHLDENRHPTVKVSVHAPLKSPTHYGVLGYLLGKTLKNSIPLIQSRHTLSLTAAKQLSAAIAASGAVSLYYWERDHIKSPTIEEIVEIDDHQLNEVFNSFSLTDKPDLIVLGCPHYSIYELKMVSEMLNGKVSKRLSFWVFTSRQVKLLGERMGFVQKIEKAGGKVLCDTCPIVAPLKGFKTMLTDSVKAAHYAPSMNKVSSALLPIEECVKTALEA
ncbi:MAG: aconitase X [Candidatus Freyarchaeota archaeon]